MRSEPKRVLQIVAAMNRGGIETWLMHVLRQLNPRRVRMDFLVHTANDCAYDAEIVSRGSRVIRCTRSTHSPLYPLRIQEVLRECGPYDVVHSHTHHFSGFLLRLAHRAGVPFRIAHSHSDTRRNDSAAGLLRSGYLKITKSWIQTHATHLVGASRVAARALFGDSWSQDPRQRLLHCGIDLTPFRKRPERAAVRAHLNIGENEFVIGHVGRFDTPKNHLFLAAIAAEVVRHRPATRIVLMGDGPMREAVETRLAELAIASRTIITGARADVPDLLNALDVFLFPSLWEGLPLAVLEAQAAGLPCVLSDVISPEVDLVTPLINRLPLSAGAPAWASAVLAAAANPRPDRQSSLSVVEDSGFNIRHSIQDLYEIYAC